MTSCNPIKFGLLCVLLVLSLGWSVASFTQDEISHFSLLMPNVQPMQVSQVRLIQNDSWLNFIRTFYQLLFLFLE